MSQVIQMELRHSDLLTIKLDKGQALELLSRVLRPVNSVKDVKTHKLIGNHTLVIMLDEVVLHTEILDKSYYTLLDVIELSQLITLDVMTITSRIKKKGV